MTLDREIPGLNPTAVLTVTRALRLLHISGHQFILF